MDLTNSTFAPLRVMVDELARCGVTDAVLCPGSRDVPLIYCFADHHQITVHSVLDERSAGFFALGIAKQSGRPAALVCTSGTAAANFLPAVVEASEANVGLIVLTADRPPELRDVGAGQVIDQIKIYGGYTRWFNEVGLMNLDEQSLLHHRGLACRAFAEACSDRAGPVHLNVSLRDPLTPQQSDLAELQLTDAASGREDGSPWLATTHAVLAGSEDLAQRLAAAARPLLVVGELRSEQERQAIADVSARLSIPVFADCLSGLRANRYSQTACIMAAYETALREPTVASQIDPDLIVRIGPLATSKPLRQWLADS
ncbi:MAG: 2-succinyl-5-enolpyruvyl-6-hydroxy-3-cyclohexene-1-carboxylic-acid synthase, partial [Thermoleophilaceae bacterium]|nr:2-succinyl-5-enolpyruvyl-6-hydroxy-3-cyclohexene-1-carboxylic-acid synthase [Thermoleophilaceae bacterium]